MVKTAARGRPRKKIMGNDKGTPEIQNKRLIILKTLTPHSPTPAILAALSGSRLHTLFVNGWISEGMLEAGLWYAQIMHRAYRSRGIPIRLRSQLVPEHERLHAQSCEDPKAEKIWALLDQNLKPASRCLLEQLITVNPAPWPQKNEVIKTMLDLLKVCETLCQPNLGLRLTWVALDLRTSP
jgi:hypothetical protein